ncbi:dihydrodipicolinate synthetase protein [Rutstroemia sp. NJR-2017a BBW]|nr:dihydrodipicolinate synthetase protein [Rutstroemia sp. NJR-2017a BBW]
MNSQTPSTNARQATLKHTYPVPEPGCYVPAVTFFDPETDQLCPDKQAKYFAYLASTKLKGLVILGTNAETFLLSRAERKELLLLARKSVPGETPIIAGVSDEAGANFALVLPCAYFGKQTTPEVVKAFYAQVAEKSPLPIVIYNFPAVCNGLDLDSTIITEIAQDPKVVGVKLTCGSVAKIQRLSATFPVERFAVFGGQSDFLIGGLAAGSAGCIAAFANIFPNAVVEVYDLWMEGKYEEAKDFQNVIALAESATKAGIANTKYAAAVFTAPRAGIEDAVDFLRPRRPYLEPTAAIKDGIRNTMTAANARETKILSARAA